MYADHQFTVEMFTGSPSEGYAALDTSTTIPLTTIMVSLMPYFSKGEDAALIWVASIKRSECTAPHIVRKEIDYAARKHFESKGLARRYNHYAMGWRVMLADEYDKLMNETLDRVIGNTIDLSDPDAWPVISVNGIYITLIPHAYTFCTGQSSSTVILFEISGDLKVYPVDRVQFLKDMNSFLVGYWHNMGRKYRALFKGGIEYKSVFADELKAFESSIYSMARGIGE